MLSCDMHPRHRLDLRAVDVAYGLGAVLLARDERRLARRVLARAGAERDGLVTASVRAAWDLLLGACGWPAGSEVVVSAITHPAMAAIAAEHGLVVVPVDLDLETLLPTTGAVAAALGPRTVAVLVAQLFGGRGDLGDLAALCRDHGLLLVEDAAQAWCGPAALRSAADVTFVSFGLIKTASAVGGALVRVDDADLRGRVAAIQDGWPPEPCGERARRLLRAGALVLLTRPGPYGVLWSVLSRRGLDVEELLDRATRSASSTSVRRRRPSASLLALLARRLRAGDPSVARTRCRTAVGEELRAARPGLPGASTAQTHWLFPLSSDDPRSLVEELRGAGVDASAGTSNLVALTTDGVAAELMRGVVYVPVYPELPARARDSVRQVLADGRPEPAASLTG